MSYAALLTRLEEMVKEEEFEVTFVKKDKSERKMKCVLGGYSIHLDKGLVNVWDTDNDGPRTINLDTISELKFEDKVFVRKEDQWTTKQK